MKKHEFGKSYSSGNKALNKRYENTLTFLNKHINPPSNILDLGVINPLSELLISRGFNVTNTPKGIDLDTDIDIFPEQKFEVVTAFEIFEHLVAPFNILRRLNAPKLVASVPIPLWFAKAYWNEKDEWDRHYHEFEPRQFDWLIDKSGWKKVDSKIWNSYSGYIGIRPILRRFTPRYYIVYCERKC